MVPPWIGDAMASETFLVCSSDPAHATSFHGYGFFGADFVYGNDGARAFAEQTGRRPGPGEDGCYVCVEKDGADLVFGSDFSGYKKVFYFHDGEFWAVSNSIHRLVEHLRRHKRPILPNYAQLAAINGGGTAHSQLSSFATPVHGVALAPIGVDLRIGDRGASLQGDLREGPRSPSYEAALEGFVDLWVRRFATLLSHEEATVTPDITGGLDSRTVFGLVHKATELLGARARVEPRYRCAIRDNPMDLRVAQSVADRFGAPVIRAAPAQRGARIDRFESWRDLCLGAYHPIYFPDRRWHPLDFAVSGGGGENHRSFYARHKGCETYDGFLSTYAKHVRPEFLAPQFSSEIVAAMRCIESRLPAEQKQDRLVLHYRHFRNRLHTGRFPQYQVMLTPLSSSHLEDCAAVAGKGRMDSGQILYDVMASTVPELLEIAFDAEAKAPSEEVRSGLTKVRLRDDPTPGAIFACPPAEEGDAPGAATNPFHRLRQAFDEARTIPFVEAFCGADLLASADELLARAEEVDRFPHAHDAKPIAAVLTCAMARP